jgi:hypothetical protein
VDDALMGRQPSGQNRSSAVMQQRAEPHDSVSIGDAKARGLRWYFTGVPCSKGHIAKRSLTNRECRACVDARRAAKDAADPERARTRNIRRYHKDIKASREKTRDARNRHIEKRRIEDRLRYHRDPAPKKARAVEWSRKNKGKRAAIIAARRMKQKRATPDWLSAEQMAAIREFYLEASSRIGEWQVDHIIPINGRLVCGLHVPWNLQILTGDANRKKGNKHAAE